MSGDLPLLQTAQVSLRLWEMSGWSLAPETRVKPPTPHGVRPTPATASHLPSPNHAAERSLPLRLPKPGTTGARGAQAHHHEA